MAGLDGGSIWARGLRLCVGIKGLEIGFPELQPIGAARLLSGRGAGGNAGGALEVVGDVGLVFWQAHGAGADCHEVSQKAEPRSVAGLGVAVLLLLLASAAYLSFRWTGQINLFRRRMPGVDKVLEHAAFRLASTGGEELW